MIFEIGYPCSSGVQKTNLDGSVAPPEVLMPSDYKSAGLDLIFFGQCPSNVRERVVSSFDMLCFSEDAFHPRPFIMFQLILPSSGLILG
jgi:hypothetical protein